MTNRCPITCEPIEEGQRYSRRGLDRLSRSLVDLEDLAYTAVEQRHEALARATKMSIQGVQPKLSARLRIKASQFEIVDRGGRYILKPQHHAFEHLPENEAVTMHLASTVGIAVPPHGLLRCRDGSLTYFVKRFDRVGKNRKLATEDFAQLAGERRDTKYDFSMERLVPLIDEHCTFPAIDRVELFRRVIFCFLTGNEDMHLKNFSVLVADGLVKLAPGYDLLNTTIALRRAQEEIALPIHGKKRNLTRNDLIRYFAGERLGLNDGVIEDVLADFARALPDWPSALDSSLLPNEFVERYLEVVEERQRRLLL